MNPGLTGIDQNTETWPDPKMIKMDRSPPVILPHASSCPTPFYDHTPLLNSTIK
jgi:hypothetical protein